jgi:2-isopropylmalate synthase
MARVSILDTTLRDGAQGFDVTFTVSDKLNIMRALDEFGVDFIEAGNPGSNPKDAEFFAVAAAEPLRSSRLVAFGATRRAGIDADGDPGLAALLAAQTGTVVVFGKASPAHVEGVLRVSLDENLAMITDTVAFLKAQGRDVIFDAEHFFDGHALDAAYAMRCLEAAAEAGASVICLCDTNGGTLPDMAAKVTAKVVAAVAAPIGIHAHNDAGCAVANSIMAVQAGASHVQGTFIGIGERCGNADLSAILPALRQKMGLDGGFDLARLTPTANTIAGIANVVLPNNRPYVGSGAFTHKAGMHADGVLKFSAAFEHIDPKTVGNARHMPMSEFSGRGSVLARVQAFAPGLERGSPKLERVISRLKQLEHQGWQFEAADASFELMARRELGGFKPHFSVHFYKTMGEFPMGADSLPATATVQIEALGRVEIAAARGKGPVHALDEALRKALTVFYPQLGEMRLTDYKVRVLEQKAATAAKVRVIIESADSHGAWTTMGVSEDIIEASFIALVDSIEYCLSREEGDAQ